MSSVIWFMMQLLLLCFVTAGIAFPGSGDMLSPSSGSSNLFGWANTQDDDSPKNPPPLNAPKTPVIVIGGSLSGWHALVHIIEKLPPGHPPVVVSEHLLASQDLSHGDPQDYQSFTRMLRGETREKIVICNEEKNAPPQDYALEDGTVFVGRGIVLTTNSNREPIVRSYWYMDQKYLYDFPGIGMIDKLFASAARIFADKTIAVVLSGASGQDGKRGLGSVHRKQGIILIQKILPEEERIYDKTMPEDIIRAGIPCRSIPVNNLVEHIMDCVREMALELDLTPAVETSA